MALPIRLIANSLLEKSFDENNRLNPMKLQKMLYLIENEYVKETKESLFGVDFQAWKYGPVNAQLHDVLECFKANEINVYLKNAKGQGHTFNLESNPTVNEIVTRIWVRTRNFDAITLANLTREPDGAWHKAWKANERNIKINYMLEDYTYLGKNHLKLVR